MNFQIYCFDKILKSLVKHIIIMIFLIKTSDHRYVLRFLNRKKKFYWFNYIFDSFLTLPSHQNVNMPHTVTFVENI